MLQKRNKKKRRRWQDVTALNGISGDFKGKKMCGWRLYGCLALEIDHWRGKLLTIYCNCVEKYEMKRAEKRADDWIPRGFFAALFLFGWHLNESSCVFIWEKTIIRVSCTCKRLNEKMFCKSLLNVDLDAEWEKWFYKAVSQMTFFARERRLNGKAIWKEIREETGSR